LRFDWSEEQEEFRRSLRALVADAQGDAHEGDIREVASDDHLEFARDFVLALAERGWLAPHWPEEYGGYSDAWRHIILGEELWSRGEPRGPQYMNVNWVAPMIMEAGTQEQKDYHLDRIRRGDVLWCQGFSEPEAGSDLSSLRTQARREGDEYVINGQKIWTSYAHVANFCFLLARTDPEARPNAGISILLVPMDTPGIEVREIPALAGAHQFHEVFFTDVHVPTSALLGRENGGWELVRKLLTFERVGAPRYASSALELDRLAAWAIEHARFDDAEVQRELGEARAACEAARMLTYRVIDERQKGMPPGGNAYAARAAMVDAERAVSSAASAVMGAHGLVSNSIADRQLASAQIAGVASGAYEIQLNLIARLCLHLPKA
jgi:alkylation response protein AidB-like acyl-CoA dehydrogenase